MKLDWHKTESAEILRLRAASNAAIAAHDAVQLASFVTPDVCVTTGRGEVHTGQAAMQARFEDLFARFPDIVYTRSPERIEVSTAAPLACEHGNWHGHWSNNGAATHVAGTYMAMWHQLEAGWRIRSELYVLLQSSESPAG